eukprot:Hpha_TRINITY_DN11009_c1_g3::TRINITY_DN11009_c1_g3_i1::g.92639::m.92639
MSVSEEPSRPAMLPHAFLFEWHDAELTPYALRYLLTHLLEMSWCVDYSPLDAVLKPLGIALGRPADTIARLWVDTAVAVASARGKPSATPVRFIDLCSGAGGPCFVAAYRSNEMLREGTGAAAGMGDIELQVSDLVPHVAHWRDRIEMHAKRNSIRARVSCIEESVDATAVSARVLAGGRGAHNVLSIHAAFHHFPDAFQLRFLRSTIDNPDVDCVLIIEASEHRLTSAIILSVLLGCILSWVSPLLALYELLATGWKQGNISSSAWLAVQILLCWPFFPFVATWDTFISCMRTKTSQELFALAQAADDQKRFTWHAAVRAMGPAIPLAPSAVYLRGVRNSKEG